MLQLARSASFKKPKQNGYFLTEDQCMPDEVQQAPQAARPRLDCCWSKILSLQSDFANEKPLLKRIIEEAGHVCLFLPKFHCELNPIELFWSFIKNRKSNFNFVTIFPSSHDFTSLSGFCESSIDCKTFKDSKALFETSRKSCSISTIRKYFRKIDCQVSAYR